METINTVIVCTTIFLIVLSIVGGVIIEEMNDTPYEQCLETCDYSDKIGCARTCNEAVIEIVSDFQELVGDVLESECLSSQSKSITKEKVE